MKKVNDKVTMHLVATQEFEGDVIVTDPCYFIPDNLWQELVKAWYDNGSANEYTNRGVIEIDGARILYSGTAYGDGIYYVKCSNGKSVHNKETGVDAGMIAVALVDDIKKINPDFDVNDTWYPRINNFYGEVTADGNGNFIGAIEVITE